MNKNLKDFDVKIKITSREDKIKINVTDLIRNGKK